MKLSRIIVAILLCLSAVLGARAQSPDSSEYLIKAGYIFNFAQLVQWPAGALPHEDSPIVIGILGTDPFGGTIDQVLANKKVDGRSVIVKRLNRGASVKDCNILFISSSEAAHLSEVLQSVKGLPILTIGEIPGFANRGGIINLTLEENRVRFQVNIEAAKRANLNISSRLLALAKIVTQTVAD